MKDYLDLYRVDHTHADGEDPDCIGNPNIVPESVVQEFFQRLVNVNISDLNHRTGELIDEEGHKYCTADRIVEDDDAMSVAERIAWRADYKLYTLTLTPDWDLINPAIKNNDEHMKYLAQLQGKVFEDDDVEAMLDTLTVSNVKVSEDGVVQGYDNTSTTLYTYTPVKDAKK